MPTVSTDTIRRLVEAFRTDAEGGAYVPVHAGRRGNPVLWAAELFPQLLRLRGDSGARSLLSANVEAVREVAVDDPGVLADVDTPQDLREIELD
jgi:molybdenum cofactor cytidylyltransferase